MNAKKLSILYVLDVLKKYSDQDHKLKQSDIITAIKRDYDMECERKSISRNISYLKEFGYDIETKADNGEGIWLVSREFDDAELRLLIDSVYSSKFLSDASTKDLIEKLNGKSSKYFKSRTKHIIPIKGNSNKHSSSVFYNIDIIDEAIDHKKQIAFLYNYYGIDKKLHPKYERKYIVNPYQILINNSMYYLIGNVDKYDNVANFRIDLISSIDINEKSHIKSINKITGYENGFDLNKIKNESPYMFSGKTENIVIKTKESFVGDVIDWFGENIHITKLGEDEVEIRFKANVTAIRYWLLQYGLYLEVMSPMKLRKMHINDVDTIKAKYNA